MMKLFYSALVCTVLCGVLPAQENGDFDEFDQFDADIQRQVDAVSVPDPIEPVNRGFCWFNDKLYFYLLKPVAVGYKTVTPKPVRKSVGNFFGNLGFPRRLANNLLQGKFRGAGEELRNFTFNTTAGCLGLFNVAEEHYGWAPRDEDFGQTLASYGAGPWMALHLPVFGPSNLRDTVGRLPDMFLDPVMYLDSWGARMAVRSGERVNFVSLNIGFYEGIKEEQLDLYRFLQDAYEQNRQKKIRE
jgi:phospholipid-binding lipoprotein MlaA